MIFRRKKRIPVTAETFKLLLHHHPGLQVTLHETHAEVTWAGRVFIAPLAPVETEAS